MPANLRSYVRDVPDFPRPGIVFKDITPLLSNPAAFDSAIGAMCSPLENTGVTKIAAIESRGFIFGSCMARRLGCGFIPIRKPGKLPWTTYRCDYTLEYGTDALEIHCDAVGPSDRVVVVDDVLATGGTAAAAAQLVARFGAAPAALVVLIELEFLSGRSRLQDLPVHSVIRY